MATYRSKSDLTALFAQNDVPSGTDFSDLVLSLSVRQTISGKVSVSSATTFWLALFPNKACTITRVTLCTSLGTACDVIVGFAPNTSSTITSINTVAQTLNTTYTNVNLTLNNATTAAGDKLAMTFSNLTANPDVLYCVEYYEAV
jgi:hypothetical protein